MLEFFLIESNFYHHRQFRSASGRSSDAPNAAVHLEPARFLFKSDLIFTTTDS
jgi:hypothetical protein